MYLYFLSAVPCAVKFNGRYIGKASENYSIIPSEKGLIEFIPFSSNYVPVCLQWNEKTVDKCENASIIDLYGAFLIIPNFKRQIVSEYESIFFKQVEYPDFIAEVSVYIENGVKISVTANGDKKTEGIAFKPTSAEIEKACVYGNNYLLVFLTGKKTIATGFKLGKKIETVLRRECDEYSAKGDEVVITELKNDALHHVVTSYWQFGESVKIRKAEIKRGRELFSVPDCLLPYAFFEELQLGKNVADFLAPSLRPRSAELRGFFGDFSAALPPPCHRSDDEILLLYGDKAEYAKLSFHGRLIDGVSLTTNGN